MGNSESTAGDASNGGGRTGMNEYCFVQGIVGTENGGTEPYFDGFMAGLCSTRSDWQSSYSDGAKWASGGGYIGVSAGCGDFDRGQAYPVSSEGNSGEDICCARNPAGFKWYGVKITPAVGDIIECCSGREIWKCKFPAQGGNVFWPRETIPKYNIVTWENGHVSPIRHVENNVGFTDHLYLDTGDVIIDKLNTLENDPKVTWDRQIARDGPDKLRKCTYYSMEEGPGGIMRPTKFKYDVVGDLPNKVEKIEYDRSKKHYGGYCCVYKT